MLPAVAGLAYSSSSVAGVGSWIAWAFGAIMTVPSISYRMGYYLSRRRLRRPANARRRRCHIQLQVMGEGLDMQTVPGGLIWRRRVSIHGGSDVTAGHSLAGCPTGVSGIASLQVRGTREWTRRRWEAS